MERTGIVTMKGNPLTLIGPALSLGDAAPDFTVFDQDLKVANRRIKRRGNGYDFKRFSRKN